MERILTGVEVCAGAGGQAIGLENAGIKHLAYVDNDARCCETLRLNRPDVPVFECDLENFDGRPFHGTDVLSGGLPCPPFSVAGKQLGKDDERNLFPAFFRLVKEIEPKAVFIENVRGFLDPKFDDYRTLIKKTFAGLGYECDWALLNASDFGVPQLRPRVAIVALPNLTMRHFRFPQGTDRTKTVGETLLDLMAANGWNGAKAWAKAANTIAPTIVGGSKKHGGPDLGPTRARKKWAELGVEGRTIADTPPARDHIGMPRLTVRMVARLQGFPDNWKFAGKKTPAYKQVGNAFPPPVATAIGKAIVTAIYAAEDTQTDLTRTPQTSAV